MNIAYSIRKQAKIKLKEPHQIVNIEQSIRTASKLPEKSQKNHLLNIFKSLGMLLICFYIYSNNVFAVNIYNYGSDIDHNYIMEEYLKLPKYLQFVDNIYLQNNVNEYAAYVYDDNKNDIYFTNFHHYWMSDAEYKNFLKHTLYHELGHLVMFKLGITPYTWQYGYLTYYNNGQLYYDNLISYNAKEDFAETFRKYFLESSYNLSLNRKDKMSNILKEMRVEYEQWIYD